MIDYLLNHQIQILFSLGIFSLAIVVYSITIKFPSIEKKRSLVLVEISTALLMIFDALSYLYRGNTTSIGYFMVRISNCFVFLAVLADFYFFNEYIKTIFKNTSKYNKNPLVLDFVSLVLLAGAFLILISQFTGWVYSFDELNVYHRGSLYPISFICPFFSAFIILIFIISNRSYIEFRIVISTLLFIILPLIAGFIQIRIYGLSMINFSIFLAAAFFFYSSLIDLNDELLGIATTDYLTKLSNLYGFMLFFNKLKDKKNLDKYNVFYFELKNISEYTTQYGSEYEFPIITAYSQAISKLVDKDELIASNTATVFQALIKKSNSDRFIEALDNLELKINLKHSIKTINIKTNAVGYSFDGSNISNRSLMEILESTQEYAISKNMESCIFMDSQIQMEMEERKKLIYDINLALTNKEFEPFYQAKTNNIDGVVCGGEALVRWKRGNEYIAPFKFIPTMEKEGNICDLDLLMLERVCEDINQWKEQGKQVVPISINFSRKHLSNPDIADIINSVVKEYGIDKDLIQIEITETIDEYSLDVLAEFVDKLHMLGFTVAIDDFGTGSSSLELLNRIEFDCLKIDKSFVDNLEGRHLKILNSIVNLTKSLKIDTVVEGVETHEQNEFLKRLGCHVIQGYFYCRPEHKDVFSKRLNGNV